MKLLDKYKIQLNIKRLTFDELLVIQDMINKEVKKRRKNLLEHK